MCTAATHTRARARTHTHHDSTHVIVFLQRCSMTGQERVTTRQRGFGCWESGDAFYPGREERAGFGGKEGIFLRKERSNL